MLASFRYGSCDCSNFCMEFSFVTVDFAFAAYFSVRSVHFGNSLELRLVFSRLSQSKCF